MTILKLLNCITDLLEDFDCLLKNKAFFNIKQFTRIIIHPGADFLPSRKCCQILSMDGHKIS